jgi:uncharacterized lipoprotein NlpE involved in copper resistance
MTILVQTYRFDPNKTREWPVPAGTLSGTAVLGASNQPGVTVTPRGDSTKTKTLTGMPYVITYPNAPIGVRTDSAIVAVDGTWAGAVTGASVSTAKNTLVYYVTSDGTLTLASNSGANPKFGVTDGYTAKGTASFTAVKIGVFA